MTAAKAQQRERHHGVPAPARAEHRRVQQRLHQQRPHRLCRQVARHVLERKTVAAKAITRSHPRCRACSSKSNLRRSAGAAPGPRAIDPAAERRMHDQAACRPLIEESFESDRRMVAAATPPGCCKVIDDLLSRCSVMPTSSVKPGDRRVARRVEPLCNRVAQPRQRLRKFVGAPPALRRARMGSWAVVLGILNAHRPRSTRMIRTTYCPAGTRRPPETPPRNPRSPCRRPATAAPTSRCSPRYPGLFRPT